MEQRETAGHIRLGVVVGPEPGLAEHVAPVLRYLERQWFYLTVLAPFAPPAGWARWSGRGAWSTVEWPRGLGAALRAERLIRSWAARLDVVDLWGPSALAAGVRSGPVTIYSRFPRLPRGPSRMEVAWARRAHAVVAMGSGGADRAFPLAQTAVDLLVEAPEAPESAPAADGAPMLWVGQGTDPSLVRIAREVAGSLGVRLDEVATLQDRAFWGARVVLLPFGAAGADPGVLDAALYAGAAVVASRVSGVVGRVRCPIEALMVDGQDAAAWRETVGELLQDLDWQRLLQQGAGQWRDLNGAGGQVRILQGVYAGTLASRTGRCPICPQDGGGSLTG